MQRFTSGYRSKLMLIPLKDMDSHCVVKLQDVSNVDNYMAQIIYKINHCDLGKVVLGTAADSSHAHSTKTISKMSNQVPFCNLH